jgi:hypothetical protein
MKNLFILFFGIALFVISISSCEKEEIEINPNDSNTKQVAKIETAYKEGCIKIETSASPLEQMAVFQALKEEIYAQQSKMNLKVALSTKAVGVFKAATCGSYPQIEVIMDCEDDNGTTEDYGYTGASYKTSSKNVRWYFCIVDGDAFRGNGKDYGVLQLHSGPLTYNEGLLLHRQYDCENTNNANNVIVTNGSMPPDAPGIIFLKDIVFHIDIFRKEQNTNPGYWPYLGMSYLVFGDNGTLQNKIHTDDEDASNHNVLFLQQWNGSYWSDIANWGNSPYNYKNIIYSTANTDTYFLSAN